MFQVTCLTSACKEGIWLRSLLRSLGLKIAESIQVKLLGDNEGSLKLAGNRSYHSETKHIQIKYHFIRDMVSDKTVAIEWIPTDSMIADCMTKPLAFPKLSAFIIAMNLQKSIGN